MLKLLLRFFSVSFENVHSFVQYVRFSHAPATNLNAFMHLSRNLMRTLVDKLFCFSSFIQCSVRCQRTRKAVCFSQKDNSRVPDRHCSHLPSRPLLVEFCTNTGTLLWNTSAWSNVSTSKCHDYALCQCRQEGGVSKGFTSETNDFFFLGGGVHKDHSSAFKKVLDFFVSPV